MIIFYIPLSAIFWVPVTAALLYAVTLITDSVAFSWGFVAIVAGILSLVSGLFLAAASD